MKALILTYEKFQDHEVIYPYYALKEHGFDVDVCANQTGRINGILGAHIKANLWINNLNVFNEEGIREIIDEYDLLLIPGGVKALEKLRLERGPVLLVQEWFRQKKFCMCICNGAQLLITANVFRTCYDKDDPVICSGYYSIEPDINNAGAIYNKGITVSKNLVSCAHYDDMGEWMKIGMEEFKKI